jgi:hypothetical protein
MNELLTLLTAHHITADDLVEFLFDDAVLDQLSEESQERLCEIGEYLAI